MNTSGIINALRFIVSISRSVNPFVTHSKPSEALPTTLWRISETYPQYQEHLVEELGLHPILARLLISRGIFNSDDARKFLNPSLGDLHNPFMMKDMQKGVDRIIQAIRRGEHIAVYGDYDADGITSVVVLLKFLQQIQSKVMYYIPDRLEDGYGINRKSIDRFKDSGVSLIVTVDCGVSDHEQVAYANTLGIDTIILDHHEVPQTLPDAVAVINPLRPDCRFPLKHLAAVGIVFNFLIALRSVLRREGFWQDKPYPNLREYLDLVAIGTIGDIVPMIDENRIFTRVGLDLMTEARRTGIRALKVACGMEDHIIDSSSASYGLIPRINAAGRVASPEDAVRLLITEDPREAIDAARKLDAYNRKRQTIEKAIFQEILEHVKLDDEQKRGCLVFSSDRWHPGVIGIVASKLADRFSRPTILISLQDGIGKGSGRSAGNINIYEGLKRRGSLLLSYGGHQYAAGISIREQHIEEFSRLIDEDLKAISCAEDFVAQTTIDAPCSLTDINYSLLHDLEKLAPFGNQNPEPVLCVKNAQASSPNVVGNNHLRMQIHADGISYPSIWFGRGHLVNAFSGVNLEVVFTPQINEWNGSSSIQLVLKDVAIQNKS